MTIDAAARARQRDWIGLGVLCLATLMVAFDTFVLLLAFPQLSAQLGADGVQQLWIADIYGFMLGGFLITMGSLGDRIGRRRLLLAGAACFGLAEVASAWATSPGMLIAARALLGIAGAALAPSILGLIRSMFRDPRQLGVAISAWASCFTLGAIVGLLGGGVLLERYWWGSAFLLGLPLMVALLIVGPLVLPEQRDPEAHRPDWLSSLLSLAAVLSVVYGVKELARYGWRVVPLLAIGVGVVFAVMFLRRQRRLPRPLLDLRLFRNRRFTVPLIALLLHSSLTGAVLLFITQHFQIVDGLSPWQAGLALAPGMLLSAIFTPLAAVLAQRIRPAILIAAGEMIVVVGLVLVMLSRFESGPALLIVGFGVWAIGGTPLLAVGMAMIIGSAPPESAGSASAMPQISNEMGNAVGVATVGSLGVAFYHAQVAGAFPDSVPGDVAQIASQSIAGAAGAASELPPELAAAVLEVAGPAFTDSLVLIAGVAAVVVLGIIGLFVSRLRAVPPVGQEDPAAEPARVSEPTG